jgi:DHA3 family tetracycline resistance protein-like MFS transporter
MMVVSVNLVYQVEAADLTPLQLVLVGTALEATIFLCEVPTGVVADVYSRRRSVLIGLPLVGVGLALSGVFPHFWPILLSQIIWGLGYTFVSGAKQAWIADEIGVAAAGRVYLRSTQVEQALRLTAIPISIGLATISLSLPIILGGSLFLPATAAWLRRSSPAPGLCGARRC